MFQYLTCYVQSLGRQVQSWKVGVSDLSHISSCQSAETQPSSSERWYIKLSIGESSSAAALRIKVDILSGTEDLNERRSLNSSFSPLELMMMLSIDENELGPLSGMLSVSSFV